jgi:CDP-diacylglycerol--serine O-phosphatidyltransferase
MTEEKQDQPRLVKKKHFTLLRSFAPADFITLANAACGMGAILCCLHYASTGERLAMLVAFALLPAAFVFDALDGFVARTTHRSSVYGGDLDSLADIVSFGVAPAAIGYVLGLNGIGDAVILCGFVMCGIARLARFNVSAPELTTAKGKVSHFEGAPIPSSLLLVAALGTAFALDAIHGDIWWGALSLGVELHPFALLYAAFGGLMVTATIKIPKP